MREQKKEIHTHRRDYDTIETSCRQHTRHNPFFESWPVFGVLSIVGYVELNKKFIIQGLCDGAVAFLLALFR